MFEPADERGRKDPLCPQEWFLRFWRQTFKQKNQRSGRFLCSKPKKLVNLDLKIKSAKIPKKIPTRGRFHNRKQWLQIGRKADFTERQ